MDNKLSTFIKSLEALRVVIETPQFHETGFKQHGWNQVHLKKENILHIIDNQISKLNSYGETTITKGLDSTIEHHIEIIDALSINAKSYFTNNASHLLHVVPNILLTLNTVFSDIDFELFSFENIQDKKLMPTALMRRLRSTEKNLDEINESNITLKEKVTLINDAHEAAESLPTDLASLKDAKNKLDTLIKSAESELAQSRQELEKIKTETTEFRDLALKAADDARLAKLDALSHEKVAAKLVEQCDEALQITTTEGLAAGFDQKAKDLKRSIWVWIIGLLIALVAGAWIGSERVTALTQALSSELSAGQAILHIVMSVFSIGGPLWLAWISTQQINQRFKLSEDYYYKATVAKSFTGFKKLAERFDPETEERLFNSTLDRLDEMPLRLIEGKDYNSPWHEFVDSESFKTAMAMFPLLAKEAGKFANKTSLKSKPKQPKHKTETTSPQPDLAEVE
jgi:hypothetical protein